MFFLLEKEREKGRDSSLVEQNASTARSPRCIWVILTASLKGNARLIHEMSGGQAWNLASTSVEVIVADVVSSTIA